MTTTHVAFDPKPRQLGVVLNMIATSAILAGDVVAMNGTAVDWKVEPCVAATTGTPIGVALYSQATAGGKVAVACMGSIVKVKNGTDSIIDAGDYLQDSTVAGTVEPFTGVDRGYEIGYALADIAANVTGYVYILGPHYVQKLT